MIDNKDPFGYSVGIYLWVFGLALIGGAVKYLNQKGPFTLMGLVRDLVTAGFAGLLTFWLCEYWKIGGPLSAVLIATSGLMGTRALRRIEDSYLAKVGLPSLGGADNESQAQPSLIDKGAKQEGE